MKSLRTWDDGLKIFLPPVNTPHTSSPSHGHTAQQHYNNISNTTITPEQQQPLYMR